MNWQRYADSEDRRDFYDSPEVAAKLSNMVQDLLEGDRGAMQRARGYLEGFREAQILPDLVAAQRSGAKAEELYDLRPHLKKWVRGLIQQTKGRSSIGHRSIRSHS